MTKHTLSVQPRQIRGRAVKKLRATGFLPANIFGKQISSTNIQLGSKDFSKFIAQVGESSLIYLQVAEEKSDRPVLLREIVKHPVTSELLHATFQQVDLKEKTTATIPLLLSGESPAESEKVGILVQQLNEVEVEALPTDIPESITVDTSSLTEVGSSIAIDDLHLNPSVFTLVTDPKSVIVQIQPLAKEEEVAPPGAEAEKGTEEPVTSEETAPKESTEAAPAEES